jgi:hypothetical protein
VSGAGWTSSGQKASELTACGAVFAFLTSEAAQGGDLDDDGDQLEDVLQLYDPATNEVVNTHQSARSFVCNPYLVAFATNEEDAGANGMNTDLQTGTGSPFSATDVIQAYDLTRPECLAASSRPTAS